MIKKLLLACLMVLPLSTVAYADAATSAIGYYSTSCGSAPSPCFIQYGATVPVSGSISGGTITSITNPVGIKGADGSTISSVSNPIPIEGNAASGVTIAGNPIGNGCRAATTTPTAVTDGQAVFYQCGAEGKAVTLPYSIKENAVRGTASGTDNAAHSIIASAGGSLKNYITSMQCSNTSSTTTTVSVNDSATSVFIVPAVGGTNLTFPVPLVTAAATAFSFTAATGVTTMTCNAQGYVGL